MVLVAPGSPLTPAPGARPPPPRPPPPPPPPTPPPPRPKAPIQSYSTQTPPRNGDPTRLRRAVAAAAGGDGAREATTGPGPTRTRGDTLATARLRRNRPLT
jgi:hypothetical protein